MQPPYVHQPVELAALVAGLLIWRVMETVVDLKTVSRLRAGAHPQDNGSRWVLIGVAVVGIVLGVVLAFKAPATSITSARTLLFWLGIVLIYGGIALRLYAIHVLGAFFTTSVAVAPGQSVVETGPYRLIRHPSYTGFLIIVLGLGLTCANWLSLLVMLICSLAGLSYRILVEERVLRQQLGLPYEEYMRRTKRLIPFVL